MMKTGVVAAAVAVWSIAGAAFAAPTIQDKAKATTVAVKDKTENAGAAGKVVDDEAITTEVKARLAKDKVGKKTSIGVETKDAVVTITGSVPSGSDVVRLGRLVETTKGVKSVVNEVTIAKK
jgi:osmotically-inducible protein OsmY